MDPKSQEETKETKAEESGDEEETKDGGDAAKKKKKRNKKKKGVAVNIPIPEGSVMGTREQDNSHIINMGSWPAGEWR